MADTDISLSEWRLGMVDAVKGVDQKIDRAEDKLREDYHRDIDNIKGEIVVIRKELIDLRKEVSDAKQEIQVVRAEQSEVKTQIITKILEGDHQSAITIEQLKQASEEGESTGKKWGTIIGTVLTMIGALIAKILGII